MFEQFNKAVKDNQQDSILSEILKEIDNLIPNIHENNSEIYIDMVEQGTMQNFGLIINKFGKCDNELIINLLIVLLDFSAFIDPLATDNPARPDNIIAIQAFIQSNIITRIFKLIQLIKDEFEILIENTKQNIRIAD